MFDILVDHPKKRYYLLMICFCVFLIGSMIFDTMFGWSVIQAESFSDLTNVIMSHPNSYIGYFFYSLITSTALYSSDVFVLLGYILSIMVTSFNFFDWFTILGITGLSISHKNKMSKATLGIQIGYLVLRVLILIGMVMFLYPAMMMNNATLVLSRIHLAGIIMFVIHIVLLVFMAGYLLNIIRLLYLPMFEEADN